MKVDSSSFWRYKNAPHFDSQRRDKRLLAPPTNPHTQTHKASLLTHRCNDRPFKVKPSKTSFLRRNRQTKQYKALIPHSPLHWSATPAPLRSRRYPVLHWKVALALESVAVVHVMKLTKAGSAQGIWLHSEQADQVLVRALHAGVP